MTPQEIMLLPVAPVGGDGSPRCITCATAKPDAVDWSLDTAPVMVVAELQPALCVCPTCGAKAQTPAILAVAILAVRGGSGVHAARVEVAAAAQALRDLGVDVDALPGEPMAASTPPAFATGALKDALDRALPELREAASRAGERRVVVLLTGQVNAAENGPWEWNEAAGEWARPAIVSLVSRVVDAPPGKS